MKIPKWKNFTKEEIQSLIYESYTRQEVLNKMGYESKRNTKIFTQILQEYPDLDISNFSKRPYRRKNIIGQTFGNLTVLELDEEKTEKGKVTYYKVQCSCPKKTIFVVRYGDLISGNTKSCGCIRYKNLQAGDMYGKLKIIEKDLEKSKEKVYYKVECQCDAHTVFSVRRDHLVSGHTTSCGCLVSLGEEKIAKILNQLKIKFEKQKIFKNLIGSFTNLRFDFYLSEKNICIEYQGKQHYESVTFFDGENNFNQRQEYDNKKRQYCKENNIKLIEIPYWDYDKIDEKYLLNLINT